jgi:hypothetical protein
MFCIRARSSQAAENSDDVKARVDLAFRPTSKFFVFDPNPAAAVPACKNRALIQMKQNF